MFCIQPLILYQGKLYFSGEKKRENNRKMLRVHVVENVVMIFTYSIQIHDSFVSSVNRFSKYIFVFRNGFIFRSAQPQCLGGLLIYFSGQINEHYQQRAILYGVGLIFCSFIATAASNPYLFYAFQIGMKIRVLCTSLIYRKVIETLSSSATC